MRRTRTYLPLILTCFMTACATPSQDTRQTAEATIIDLPQAVHFQSPEGADLLVNAGAYHVERAAAEGLRLKGVDTAGSVTVKSEQTTHDFTLHGPLALYAPEGDDIRHIALLLPTGEAVDAPGSVSGVQSRATISPTMSRLAMQQSVQVLRPTKLALFAIIPPDPCAGAIPSLPAPPPPPSNLPQITPGQGPIADVVDWQPKNKIPAGREIIIQGRNLDPAGLYASIGGTRLLPTTKSASEVRFTVPSGLRAYNAPFVVFQQGGTPRTLETNYEVFDPAVRITRVVPETFSPGDEVTICGVSVTHMSLTEAVRTNGTGAGVVQSETRRLALIGLPNGQYQNYHYFEILNPVGSPSGDRLTFVVGSYLYKAVFRTASPDGKSAYTDIVSDPAPPVPVSGPLTFHSDTNPTTSRDVMAPNPVTWRLGGPKIVKVGMHPNSQFTLGEPFLIQPTFLPGNVPYPGYGVGRLFVVEGYNLQGQYRLGTVTFSQISVFSNDYTKIGLSPPPTAVSAPLCGTNNGITTCTPQPLGVVPGPVLATIPNAPLALRTTYTINGLHLLPSGVPGLTYELYVSGLMDPNLQIAGGSAPTIGQCNMTAQVLEHTDSRIQFRIGDPGGPAPSSSCMTFRADFFSPTSPNRPTILLIAKYNGKQLTVWHQQFQLAQ